MDIQGKNTLITGSSRGLGASLAVELASRGARVVLLARARERLEQVAARIRAAGGEAHVLTGDVGEVEKAPSLAAQAAALVGPIDIVIHNASELGPVPMPLLLDASSADLERVFRVNLAGPFALSRALIGPMLIRGSGLVVHVSSDASVEPYPRWGAYGASKAALDHLGRIWAKELGSRGVSWVGIDPGEMDTQMHRDAIPDADPSALKNPDHVARRIAEIIARPVENGGRLVA
jgi:NAD(P)-dependent dehydrogenase (short-subunit alcohol dehydrogenase family)